MSMNIGSEKDDEIMSEINTTPLVDVMLVLLIIFLITIPVVTTSIKVDLPKEKNLVRETKPETVIISVDVKGKIFLYDTPIKNSDDLLQRMKKFSVMKPQPEVQIRGDGKSDFESVGRVMYAVQRAGITKVGFITEPQYRDKTMAMNVGSSSSDEPEVMMEINTTPLIDVMLVLLIMLIITIPAQLHSVNLDMPVSSPPTKKIDPVVVKIDVDANSVINWNGRPLAGRADLELKLTEAAATQPQPELHIRSHAKAKYESVALVMASAQRIGLTKLGIVGSEQFVN